METVKPIFIVKVPNMHTMKQMSDIRKALDNMPLTKEYFVLVINTELEKWEFECFYEKDFNEVKYNELKQIIKDSCGK